MTDDTSLELPPLYESLTWLTPLSEERAAHLVAFLSDPAPAEVLDMGCGWGELLLRVLTSAPQARGRGVDSASASIDRARQQALTRGLINRATFDLMPGVEAQDRPADAVICIGASQIWGRILALLLLVVAVIGIARSHHLTGLARAVWVLVVLAFPVIGPLLWFLVGRRANTSSRDAVSSPARGAK